MKSKTVTFIAVVLLSYVGSGYGQLTPHWKILHSFPGLGTCGYFWDKQHGLVAVQGSDPKQGNICPTIWHTADGINWSQSITPAYHELSPNVWITSIYMKNLDTGWASLFAGAPTNVLWKTVDGGLTWVVVPGIISGGPQDVVGNPDARWDLPTGIVEVAGQSGSDSLLLLMIGKIQYSEPWKDAFCSAWLGKQVGLIYSAPPWIQDGNTKKPPVPPNIHKTTDGGRHWTDIYTTHMDSWGWGMWGCEKWNAFFLGDFSGPYVSTDIGSSWNWHLITDSSKKAIPFTDDVEGANDVVYMQTSNSNYGVDVPPDPQNSTLNNTGLYRSTDTGHTWVNVGGPSNLTDTRFSVLGCHGATVIAFDASGGVWLTEDGGDGKLGNGFAHPLLSDTSLQSTASVCSNIANRFRFHDEHCDAFELDSISFADSTLVRLGALTLDSIPALPKLYGSNDSGFVEYRWRPGAAFTKDTTVTNGIVLRYRSITTGQEYDTTISLHLIATSGKASHTLSEYELSYVPTGTCSFTDTSFLIRNHGCGTLRVDSIIADGLDYSVLSFDSVLAVNGSGTVVVRFHPSLGGDSHGSLRIHTTQQGVSAWDTLPTVGTGIQGMGILNVFSTSLQAGSFSFCAGDTTISTSISNTGCDTLRITNIRFAGDATFALTSSLSDTLLPPGATKSFGFSFAPRTKGAHSGTLTFHSQNLHGSDAGHDTTISVAGFGTRGHKYIGASIASADLGAIYACQLRDTMLTLTNPGCDTLRVIAGTFDNPAYHSDRIYPIVLPPDSSAPVHVFLTPDTTGHPMTINGTVTFQSDADTGSTISIPLTVSMIYPQHLSLSLSPQDSAGAGKPVTFKLILSGNAPGLSALHFDLTNDDNLLSFVSANGNGLTWTPGTPPTTRHFTLSPVPAPGEIGTLSFQTFLSTTSATPITLSQPTFENDRNVPNECIASVGDSSSAFSYIYSCSQGLMQDLMNGVPFNVDRVVPNPATNNIDVYYHFQKTDVNSEQSSIECKMYDLLGRMHMRQTGAESGNQISLDVSSLPAGVYSLQIQMAGTTKNRRVVIAR